MTKRAQFDTIRTLVFGDISGTYAAVGSPFAVEPRIVCITNGTDADMYFTDDGTNDKIVVTMGTNKMFNFTASMQPRNDDAFVMAKGTQISVKQISAPTSGSVYVELIY